MAIRVEYGPSAATVGRMSYMHKQDKLDILHQQNDLLKNYVRLVLDNQQRHNQQVR